VGFNAAFHTDARNGHSQVAVDAPTEHRKRRSPREAGFLLWSGVLLLRCGPARGRAQVLRPWVKRPAAKTTTPTAQSNIELGSGTGSASVL